MRQLSFLVLAVLAPLVFADDAVVIFKDRKTPARRVPANTVGAIQDEVSALWVWSSTVPPRRTDVAGLNGTLARRAGGTLDVRIDRQRLPKDTRVRVIAAPTTAWEEVREDFLPSWTVLAGETVRVPVDLNLTWRIRVAGARFGTWWTDVPPGRSAVILSPVEAPDRVLRFESETGDRLVNARLSILDEAAERGRFTKIADYRSDEKGSVRIAALPDASAMTLVGSTPDRAPRVMEARAAAFPDRLVLHPGAVVRARVVDSDRKPISNAQVALRTWLAETLPVPLLLTATSTPDGVWVISGIPAGGAEWRVSAEGYAPAVHPLRPGLADQIDLGAIVLQRAATIAVRVKDDRGQPVRASVSVNGGPAATTNAKGEATLPVPPDRASDIVAVARSHQRVAREVRPPFPEIVEIELRRSFRVTGRIVDDEGAAVSQASIRAVQGSSFSSRDAGLDGTFEIDLEPGLDYRFEIRSPATAVAHIDVSAGAAGETRDLGDVTAPPGTIVTGRLVRASDHTAVAGARVWLPRPSEDGPLMAWAFRDVLQTESGPDGGFELRGLPDAPFTMRIDAPSLASARRRVVPDGAKTDLGEVPLSSGVTLTVLLEGDGGDDASAQVDTGGTGMPADLLTAPFVNGRAVIADVPQGPITIAATRRKETLCRQQAILPKDVPEMEITCRARMVRIDGTVAVHGRPGAMGTVYFLPPFDHDVATGIFENGSGGYRQQTVFSPQEARLSADVGPDGRFTVPRLLAGSWDVFWMPERGRALAPRRIVVPATDAHALLLEYSGPTLRGTVVDGHGRPVAGAEVRDLGGAGFARSSSDGTFVLAGPASGTWRVQARYRDHSSRVHDIELAEDRPHEPVVLRLEEEASTVRITAPASALLFVETDSGTLRVVNTGADGSAEFRFQSPLPTRIRIAASAGGAFLLAGWISFDAAVKKGGSLERSRTGTLAVQSRKQHGAVGISGAGWRIDRLLQWLGVFPTADPDTPLVVRLPIGTYEVTLANATRVVTIERDRTSRVTFD